MKYKHRVFSIGPKKRITKLLYGLFFLLLGAWLWIFISTNKFHPFTNYYLFIPFYLAFLGIYQALFGFCIKHGTLHPFQGSSRVTGKKHRRKVLFIQLISVVSSFLLTLYFLSLEV